MANTFNTATTLNAMMKDLHGKVTKAIPLNRKAQREYAIDESNLVGRKFLEPVVLTNCHGITFSKANNGAFTLNDSIPMVVGEAQVEPAQIMVVETVDYESLFRTSNGERSAHEPAVKAVMQAMVDSLSKEVEMAIFYGQSSGGYGLVNAATSASTSFVISEATWAPGYWAGKKGARINLLNASFASDEDNDETIASVNTSTRTITVGNAQTLDASDIVAPYLWVEDDASTPVHHSMAGFDKIITNSGTLFNISASTYADLWKGQEVTVTGDPTFRKLLGGVSAVADLGCDVGLIAWVSPKAFEYLNSDIAGLRRFDGGYRHSKAESGTESLVFYGQTGRLRVEPHPMVKRGDAFVLPDGESGLIKRKASTDITFRRPGAKSEEDMAVESTGVAGCEIRAYTAQQVFCSKPAWMAKVTGFTYS